MTDQGRGAVEQHWRRLEQLRGKARRWVPEGTESLNPPRAR
ncbi:MAG TPA: hypothetical protein VF794_34260 [Archangium sp.]